MTIKIRFRGRRHPTSGELISLTKRQARQLQRHVLLDPVISLPLPRGVASAGGNLHRHAVQAEAGFSTDLLLSEPYDWGPQGRPAVKPVRYVPGQGWDMGDD